MFSNREDRANCISAEDKFLAFNAFLDAEHSQSASAFYCFCFCANCILSERNWYDFWNDDKMQIFFLLFFYLQTVCPGAGRFQLKVKWRRFFFLNFTPTRAIKPQGEYKKPNFENPSDSKPIYEMCTLGQPIPVGRCWVGGNEMSPPDARCYWLWVSMRKRKHY